MTKEEGVQKYLQLGLQLSDEKDPTKRMEIELQRANLKEYFYMATGKEKTLLCCGSRINGVQKVKIGEIKI